MTKRTANAAALGYGAFALTLWLTGMLTAGWFDGHADAALVPALTAVLGGCVVAVAGILQWTRGHTLDATLFLAFAAYWWLAALYRNVLVAGDAGGAPGGLPGFLGWYQFAWAFFAFCLWIAACRDGNARMLFTLGLWLSLLAAAIADWIQLHAVAELGGYLQLMTALVGIYILAAAVLNEASGHHVLPLSEEPAHRRPHA